MGIALEDAGRMNLKLKGLELAMSFYEQVKKEGCSENGTQVLMRGIKRIKPTIIFNR